MSAKPSEGLSNTRSRAAGYTGVSCVLARNWKNRSICPGRRKYHPTQYSFSKFPDEAHLGYYDTWQLLRLAPSALPDL